MRLKIVYGPDGRANEYARDNMAANLYVGCTNGCRYCSAPRTLRKDAAQFHAQAQPKENVLAKFENDCTVLQGRGISGKIFLCFVCDPYPQIEETLGITRQAIEIAHRYGFGVDILTKNGLLARRDFDLLGPQDSFGVTLTMLTGWEAWEPNADDPMERIRALKVAFERGIPTWVSCEPVISPKETRAIIQATHEFVDAYKVGKLNYHPLAGYINWPKFAKDIKAYLDDLGCQYYLKDDLRKLL
jgi:DNA repair photolyase